MKGKLTIGKVTCLGQPKDDYITITIEDTISSIQFVEVQVDLRIFSQALMGLSSVPVEFELRGMERIGKKFEQKTVPVTVRHPKNQLGLTDENIDTAVGCYEVDGWIGTREDCKNHHRHVSTEKTYDVYEVLFVRWVDAEGTDVEPKEPEIDRS